MCVLQKLNAAQVFTFVNGSSHSGKRDTPLSIFFLSVNFLFFLLFNFRIIVVDISM